ncbi:MAG: hypothetical protein V4736_13170 [Bdellovibrionota bacterium]
MKTTMILTIICLFTTSFAQAGTIPADELITLLKTTPTVGDCQLQMVDYEPRIKQSRLQIFRSESFEGALDISFSAKVKKDKNVIKLEEKNFDVGCTIFCSSQSSTKLEIKLDVNNQIESLKWKRGSRKIQCSK